MVDKDNIQLLLELGNWQVCRLTTSLVSEVFGVHLYCSVHNDEPVVFHWGWTFGDHSTDGIERCFRCRAIVPPEVVALVMLSS